jgi:hypothetical protein
MMELSRLQGDETFDYSNLVIRQGRAQTLIYCQLMRGEVKKERFSSHTCHNISHVSRLRGEDKFNPQMHECDDKLN